MDIMDRIKGQIESNPVMLYMKGTPDFPMCGFSGKAVAVLKACNAEFNAANVLEDDELRESIKVFSNWPTIPQLYIKGELIGGSDIIVEMYENGQLEEMLAGA